MFKIFEIRGKRFEYLNIIRSPKFSNPNPNIRDSRKKIWIRIESEYIRSSLLWAFIFFLSSETSVTSVKRFDEISSCNIFLLLSCIIIFDEVDADKLYFSWFIILSFYVKYKYLKILRDFSMKINRRKPKDLKRILKLKSWCFGFISKKIKHDGSKQGGGDRVTGGCV